MDGTEMAESTGSPAEPGNGGQAETVGAPTWPGPVPRVWAWRVSVALFSLWLAWLAFVALTRLSG